MEDFTIILYALAAVAYFIFTQWRKAFNSPSEDADVEVPEQERRPPPQPNRPATSFEDILRELQPKMERAEERGKSVVEKAKEQARQVAAPMVPAEAPASKYKNYEGTAPKALSWEKPAEARQAARQSEELRKRLFQQDVDQVAEKSKYAAMVQSPESVREAFVLSEIFKRKYD